MIKAIALSKTALETAQTRQAEILRSAIVLGCAAALILAGQPLPY
ncbi:hypothetical protein [Erythrobacter sp. THAF29]|nr:hypothetical protein [Erythrobacter sp. THAF29]QFT76514.1 hypothetical protein FIU90_03055 [Erythrobacter sp. THAF29]